MASLSSLVAWAVGQKVTAAKLNLTQTEVGKLQTLAAYDPFSGTRSAIVHTTAIQPNYGAYTTAGTWTTDATGIKVPTAGVYIVTMYVTKSAGVFNTRSFLNLKAGGTEIGRSSIDTGVAEANQSLTVVTGSLVAGQAISPELYQSSGGNTTTTCKLTIVRLPVDV